MDILAHRGFWRSSAEHNSETAFVRALERGYGIETDLRDLNGEVVISHDMPRAGAMPLRRFLELYCSFPGRPLLALNVKADGLQHAVQEALDGAGVSNLFLFDMAVPDMLGYLRLGLPVYARRSEYEAPSPIEARTQGLWLDQLEAGAVPAVWIAEVAARGMAVALVSPELHQRPHAEAWGAWLGELARLPPERAARVSLCTDLPDEAAAFFADRA